MSNRSSAQKKTHPKASLSESRGIADGTQDLDTEQVIDRYARLWIWRVDLKVILQRVLERHGYGEVARELAKLQPRGRPKTLVPSLLSLRAWIEVHRRQTGDDIGAACAAIVKAGGVVIATEGTARKQAILKVIKDAKTLRRNYYRARKIATSLVWRALAEWEVEMLVDMADKSKLSWRDFERRKLTQLAQNADRHRSKRRR